MSREDFELLKQYNKWQEKKTGNDKRDYEENDELIIEQNTIYEIDLDCYECLMREKRKYYHEDE